MRISALDGREIEVRRRWLPWRLRRRKVDLDFLPADFDGDLGGIVFGIVLFLFGGIVLAVAIFASEALLILPVIVLLLAAARMFWVLPWVIEARDGDTVLGLRKVRGWRDSTESIREIAAAYQRGEDPFAVRRT